MSFECHVCRFRSNNTASPNKHFKSEIGFPHEYKPNIHELKQLFDDTKRSHISSYASNIGNSEQKHGKSHQRTYSDAKPTLIDSDLNSFDLRMQSRNNAFNFERAKQKFDGRSGSNSHQKQQAQPIYSVSQKQSNSFIPKRNTYLETNAANTDEGFVTSPYKDDSKGNYSMTSSINLDGLKVSDDE